MSYDLYCYRSALGRPDLEEAQRVTDAEKAEEDIQPGEGTRLTIAKALMNFNPRLEMLEFDQDEIVKSKGISRFQTKKKYLF